MMYQYQSPASVAAQEKTQAALEAMRAYFAATARSRPQRERQQLAYEWLAAIRRLRTTTR
ncbi:MAG TPA: hypothetical protein PKI41_12935 [Candidatus Competibacteraceae bacterium]|nr:MAG: hypothetical protein EKK71_11370 [Candidatus Competibacteraceae bacterium]HOB63005.1 hypothetical protein [Candidatus Competibacteraceae bacterium]HQA27313.1 hypothetical protein [Candidatus Competibacteraceae bacterium]HQD54983.1 hypothetical protein [Candidatus Competibacteraceae bacterium]